MLTQSTKKHSILQCCPEKLKKLQLHSSTFAGLSQFLFLHCPIGKRDWNLMIKRTVISDPDNASSLFLVVQNPNFGLPWGHRGDEMY